MLVISLMFSQTEHNVTTKSKYYLHQTISITNAMLVVFKVQENQRLSPHVGIQIYFIYSTFVYKIIQSDFAFNTCIASLYIACKFS